MPDIYASFSPGLTSPYKFGQALVIGEDQTYTNTSRAIHLSTGGTIVLLLEGGQTVTMILAAGYHPIRATGHVGAGSSECVGTVLW